ncbi:MAG: sodium/proton-translocating pyrophosphatase [Phycisphaeraceae bacterium]|nr:sodium/proton-translocating pyrophosphatase [Phycisphaeraceae bacterium]
MTNLQPSLAVIAALPAMYWIAPIAAIAALLTARMLSKSVLAKSEGDAEMIRIAAAVRDGAMAYLGRQYKVVAVVFVGLVVLLGILAALGLQPSMSMIGVPIAGVLSGLCGWFGMRTATSASARTAAAAKESLNDGLQVAFRAGAVMGLIVVGFALLDISAWLFILTRFGASLGITAGGPGLSELTTIMLSFGMGASTQALFARVGGGIYTKAADVGADLVGKVEAGIPEDDPRNPATIADNVGDNVGDVAGMGADLYESYYGSILASMSLGAAAAISLRDQPASVQLTVGTALVMIPLALAGIGILASILGIFSVRTREDTDFSGLLKALHNGVYVAAGLIVLAALAVPFTLLGTSTVAETAGLVPWWRLGISVIAGLVSGLVIAQWTEYCTSYEHPPTRRIAVQAFTGPATVIIAGIAEGMKSTWASLIAVVAAILVAFISAGGGDNFLMGLYGVGIAAVGMLSTLGVTLATDAYGPIADNAGGNAEMSGQPPHVRKRTDMLDSLGNTTAATGKGFAIGSAALTALALLAAFVQVVQTQLDMQGITEARKSATAMTAADPYFDKPHAVYLGHGRFGVLLPGGENNAPPFFGSALLIDRTQLPHDQHFSQAVKPGQKLAISTVIGLDGKGGHDHHGHDHDGHDHDGHDHGHAADPSMARAYIVSAKVGHGDHDHEYTFQIVATRNASIAQIMGYYDITPINPRVLAGLFIGVMLSFLFCALTMTAVGRAAYAMMRECRRQFGIIRAALRGQGMTESQIADPSNWPTRITHDGRQYPDYAECVSISTAGAQREMVIPSLLAISVPLLVGITLSVPGSIGLLAGGLTSGFAIAVFMANAGGAWDNAKKLIESSGKITADAYLDDPSTRDNVPAELHEGIKARAEDFRRDGKGSTIVYGKGSDDHKATVVGDTVGDPFKDTSGPSLNILIKLISIVSVVFAGFVVKYGPTVGAMLGLE